MSQTRPPVIDPTDDDPDFRKSFLQTRVVVGLLGMSLPWVLFLGATRVFDESGWRGSLSAYYYSGMRDWFVGGLFAIGAGLLVYMATRRSRVDNVLSTVAGLLLLVVALFPTTGPQETESLRSVVHFASASVAVVLLGVICFRFGQRDGRRRDRRLWQQRLWRTVHMACAAVIVASVVGAGLLLWAGVYEAYAVLLAEIVSVSAFGVSWFCKGSEITSLYSGRSGRYDAEAAEGARVEVGRPLADPATA